MQRVEVSLKSRLPDARGEGLVKGIADLGIASVTGARVVDIYWLDSDLSEDKLDSIGKKLLSDPVTQEYRCFNGPEVEIQKGKLLRTVEVAHNPGVSDPAEDTVMKAIRDLGIRGVKMVKLTQRYLLRGHITRKELDIISSRLLVNPIIQHVLEPGKFSFPKNPGYKFKLNHIELLSLDAAGLEKLRKNYTFNEDEFKAIVAYFKEQGRNPTDVELETLDQTWSEHCVHKTFKAKIAFEGKTINNLLKSTIIQATQKLEKPWCLSVFEDNAGVIDFDGKWALCFKVETHNHPSAVEPYGGAATGLGGVVRDPLGTGLGAKPIANTDVFCFGPPDLPYEKLPQGVLHPRRMFKGVRAGVADYGNRLGIPTLNGAVLFDERYTANPLVYCGTLGVMPHEFTRRGQQRPGDLVVVVGGRTGRDGIRGVTFASEKLTGESSSLSYSSVQIGNAIVEKKVIDVLLQARDRRLYRRITDCGGGGLSSAVGEMAAETGVLVNLDTIPLKYSGLTYSEIWVSESQERMLLAVPPNHLEELLALFAGEDVEATVIGEFTSDRRLRLVYKNKPVGELTMEFLHEGRPQVSRKAVWKQTKHPEPDFAVPQDLTKDLMAILSSWNVCSKEWVIRQYDHEVQGGSVLKSMVGKHNDGPGDAAIIRPVIDSERGAIISNGINPRYGEIDPYWMAASAIDEALRQIIAVGGSLERVALLDNFCWGNPEKPEVLGSLVRAAEACRDMSLSFETPFISGKDSLYNEFEHEGKLVAIPDTLLISAVGIMPDTGKAVSMDFKQAGDLMYAVGATRNETGGSAYFGARGLTGNRVPQVEPESARKLMSSLSRATGKGLVKACHDCSEGGIGVALAEMAFAGGLGAAVDLKAVPLGEQIERDDFILFSESNSRFLVEVAPDNKADFEKTMSGRPCAAIGRVTDSDTLEVTGLKGKKVVNSSLSALKEAWQKPLRW